LKKQMQSVVDVNGSLDVVLIRKDGSHRDYGTVSDGRGLRLIGRPIQWSRFLWKWCIDHGIIPASMGFAAFAAIYLVVDQPEALHRLLAHPRITKMFLTLGTLVPGLVVTGGANFLATDFASGQASPRISAMNFHDSGTGTTAATSTDSGLQTQAGPATRATGTQSNPVTNQYRSVGTIAYTGTLAITEWGLFSASTSGTMWDRRVFSAINVVNGDSIGKLLSGLVRRLTLNNPFNCWKAYSYAA